MSNIEVRKFEETSYLYISGPSSKPLIFYIPGNPGICDYYREYIQELHRLTGLESIVVSQLGSDIHEKVPQEVNGRIWTLDDQVEHKIRFLNHFGSGRDVYVLGHSIGAWMAQRACLGADNTTNIKFVGLMAPTLSDMAQSERGKKLTAFKDNWGFFGVTLAISFVSVFNYLPEFILRAIVSRVVPPSGFEATLAVAKRPSIVKQILVMGFEEMDRVAEGVEADDIRGFWSLPASKWLFYAENDHWVPQETMSKTIEYAKAQQGTTTNGEESGKLLVEVKDVAHAFVLKKSIEVAGYTANAFPKARE